jgi:hypothetical protein
MQPRPQAPIRNGVVFETTTLFQFLSSSDGVVLAHRLLMPDSGGKRMRYFKVLISFLVVLVFTAGCGEEYYSTPQKTLQRYIDNRMMANREQYESCLNAFRKEDREWMEKNYMKLCSALYGPECPGESVASLAAVWQDQFEPQGPKKAEPDSIKIDEGSGEATLVVDGKTIEFVKKRGNWKIKGFFGVVPKLKEKYPQIDNAA